MNRPLSRANTDLQLAEHCVYLYGEVLMQYGWLGYKLNSGFGYSIIHYRFWKISHENSCDSVTVVLYIPLCACSSTPPVSC